MKNISKGKSNFYVIGDRQKKKILLIHGISFYWEKCFKGIIDELEKEYCLLVPELEGHNLESKGKILSVHSSATNIIEQLYAYNFQDIHAIYGISMGASIALEIALQGKVQMEKLILDGGQYESMGIMKRVYAYIISKELRKIVQGKHMTQYIQKQMGYFDNDIEVLQPLTCNAITFRRLYHAALSAYSYSIKKRKEKLQMDVTVMFGKNEVYAKKSIPLIREKCLQSFTIIQSDESGHAETLSMRPEKIINLLAEKGSA